MHSSTSYLVRHRRQVAEARKAESQFVMEGSTDSSFTEETTDHRSMCNADIQRVAEAVVHIISPRLRTQPPKQWALILFRQPMGSGKSRCCFLYG